MAKQVFKVGEAPWESAAAKADSSATSEPQSFKVGEAPWERPIEEGASGGVGTFAGPAGMLMGLFGGSKDAVAHKAVDTVAMGNLPQVVGAANMVTGGDYLPARDAEIARLAEMKKNHPVSSIAGNVIGAVALGSGTGGLMPTPAATALGRIGQGAVVGAGFGAAANPGDKAGEIDLTGQLPERAWNAAKGAGLGALLSGLVETPGMIKSGLNYAKDKVAGQLGANVEYTPIPNKAEVVSAADKLGIKDVPKAVLTDNPTYQKLESGLSQSGSFPAKSIRDQYSKLFKALDDAGEKISSLKTTDSDFALGGQIGKDLAGQVEKNTAPVSELYNDLNPLLQKIPVHKPAVNSAFGVLKKNPIFQTKDGIAMLEDQKAAIESLEELGSLKEFRSTLHDSLGSSSSPLDEKRVNAIYDAVTKIRDNSIGATKSQFPASVHGEVDALSNQIALADTAHATNLKDINSIKSLLGNKEFSSPRAFLNKLGDMKEADLAAKASNLDVSTWQALKDKFPSVFEKARAAKINDMITNSTNPLSGFGDAKFLKQWEGMDQEMKNLIFEPEIQAHINAFRTVKQAIPPKLGPSGTPEGDMMMQMINPKRNALDFGVKKALEAASNPKVSSSAAASAPSNVGAGARASIVGKTMTRPVFTEADRPKFERSAPAAKDVSESEKPKGETKWANDGIDKLKEHSRDPATINAAKAQMASDPQMKQLLINASDLKPGSKAMDKQLEKIKERLK